MEKTKRFSLLLMIVTVTLVLGGDAVEDTHQRQERKFSVGVVITCDDKNMKESIESNIIQELWRLQDVSLVDKKDAEYVLSLMVFEVDMSIERSSDVPPELRLHLPQLVVIASNYLTRATELQPIFQALKTLALEAKTPMDQQTLDDFDTAHNSYFHEPTLGGIIVNKERLEEECKELIVDFDSRILEPNR